jgi:hypothetical protein
MSWPNRKLGMLVNRLYLTFISEHQQDQSIYRKEGTPKDYLFTILCKFSLLMQIL